jgi:serine/threonine protein kinase
LCKLELYSRSHCTAEWADMTTFIKSGPCVAFVTLSKFFFHTRNEKKNLHYLAPEYGKAQPLTTASDIYSFGICALVMARPELLQGGEENKLGSISNLQATIAKIQNPLLVDLIQHCVYEDPANRNDAITLLFHPVFFEGHSLKLYAAHTVVGLDLADVFSQQPLVKGIKGPYSAEKLSEKQSYKINGKVTWKLDIEQYLEDVKIGAHPLSFYDKAHKKQTENKNQPVSAARSQTPEDHFALKITGSDDLLNGAKAVHYGSR